MLARSIFRATVPVLAAFVLAGCLFALTYYYDNKYITPPPYGAEGSMTFDDEDLDHPISLVDGWRLSVDGASQTDTFIGQYSDFSFAPDASFPASSAVYELSLRYVGSEGQRAVVLLVPEVFGEYALYVDGQLAAVRGDGPEIGLVADEHTDLRLVVEDGGFYYRGLTYPPILGTAETVAGVQFANVVLTCVLVLVPLCAAAFAFAVRRRGGGDELVRDFGVLCAAFALAGMHGIAWRMGVSGTWWYALEDAAWMCVLVASIAVSARAVGAWASGTTGAARLVARLLWMLPVVSFVWVAILIPAAPASAAIYGLFQTVSRVLCWALFAACAVTGVRCRSAEARFVLCGCAVLGASLLANMLDNNAFEPLRGLWQHEYAGLFLVGVFGLMLVVRVRRLRAAQEQVRDLEVQVRSAEESLLHMRRGEREIRVARHDLRHHVGALKQLADGREWDRCRAYLDELSQQQDARPPLRYSDNLVVNAVMTAYLSPAQEAGVRVEWDVNVPEPLAMRSTELVVLLSNLLSNAAEACDRARARKEDRDAFVSLSMRVQGLQLIIRCENTTEPETTFTKTSKPDASCHGLGLPAMRSIVESRGGALITEIQGEVAVVRMVVPLDEDVASGLRL